MCSSSSGGGCFEDDDVIHVANIVNPAGDVGTINTELLLADMEVVDKSLQKVAKQAKSANKDAIRQKDALEALKAHLDEGKFARTFEAKSTPFSNLPSATTPWPSRNRLGNALP